MSDEWKNAKKQQTNDMKRMSVSVPSQMHGNRQKITEQGERSIYELIRRDRVDLCRSPHCICKVAEGAGYPGD